MIDKNIEHIEIEHLNSEEDWKLSFSILMVLVLELKLRRGLKAGFAISTIALKALKLRRGLKGHLYLEKKF